MQRDEQIGVEAALCHIRRILAPYPPKNFSASGTRVRVRERENGEPEPIENTGQKKDTAE